MKYSKTPKTNDIVKIHRAINREIELTRNDGKWVAINKKYKDKTKYNRKQNKRELSRNLDSSLY